MFPRLLRVPLLIRTTMLIMTMMTEFVYSKPQDPGELAGQAIAVAGNIAEMAGNAGMFNKKTGFNLPFASANSETQIGTGAAMRNNDDDDDSSEEDRRKRSIENNLIALPLQHQHIHRGKRSPCRGGGGTGGGGNGGGGSGGGGTGGGGGGTGGGGGAGDGTGGDIIDDGDIDFAERRRRGNARRRNSAGRNQATSGRRTTNSQRRLVSGDDNEHQVLERRKRQTELDDLNQNVTNASNEFAQKAQQVTEQLRNIWENFMGSINDMAQKLKQHFSGKDSASATEEI